jgi:hypothetical protein
LRPFHLPWALALLLVPALAPAHTTAGTHVHEGDLGSLLALAVIAGIAVWLDRRPKG